MAENKVNTDYLLTAEEYQSISDAMAVELNTNNEWQARFGEYIDMIDTNRQIITNVVKNLYQKYPIKIYLSLSGIKNSNRSFSSKALIPFDVRYKGISLGTIKANTEEAKFYPEIRETERSIVVDDDKLKAMEGRDWNKTLYEKISSILKPEIKIAGEHQFESFLLDNFAKRRYKDKILPWSTPITWDSNRKTCFQMPTTWKGSAFSNKNINYEEGELINRIHKGEFWGENSLGGGIDILCRRSCGLQTTRLSIMELKSPGKKFDENKVILQALAYSVFIRELIRSEDAQGEKWWNFFITAGNRKNKNSKEQCNLPKKIKIEAVVVLSAKDGNNRPGFSKKIIKLDNDIIELHYLYLKDSCHDDWIYKDSDLEIWGKK